MLYANSYHCFILISERSALNHDHERYSYSLLSSGTLTAHESFCLVLLYSYPDTVHRFPLRKTQASTPLIRGSPTVNGPGQNITPTIADCWYRAPLPPQLLGDLSISFFQKKVNGFAHPRRIRFPARSRTDRFPRPRAKRRAFCARFSPRSL